MSLPTASARAIAQGIVSISSRLPAYSYRLHKTPPHHFPKHTLFFKPRACIVLTASQAVLAHAA